ncbi:reverse transcriptase domain-containing protein [Tanacetum coccineum]
MDDEPIWAADHVVAPTLVLQSLFSKPQTNLLLKKTIAFADEGSSNSDTDAMTLKMDAQYKELQSNAKKTKPDLDEDDIPMSGEEEAKFMQTFSKNRQASIQNLETKFDRLVDKQSGRPSRSLPSNTQPNPKWHNSKEYQPPQSCNEHVNVVFTRSGKSYNPLVNLNDQQNYSETPINFDIDDEDEEPKLQPKTQNPKPVKEILLPKPYKPKISIDVINEILEEDFDALLDEGSKILHSLEGTLHEEEIFAEFDEFMAMTADENFDSESDTEEPPFKKIIINTDYKIKTSPKEPPKDLELKLLPDNLEYVFLEEPSFLHVIISYQLSKEKKNKLVFVLKKHKEAFTWKTTNIPDFSKITQPITKLLEKDTPFEFDDECQKAFELLKEKLICAPVIVSPNWNLPFELMCDASDFASSNDSEVNDNFPGETLMEINTKDEPWFENFAKYLVDDIIPKGMTYQQKKKLFSDLKHYFWEEPYLFIVCSDGMIKRYISGPETQTILDQCHHGPTSGHYGPNVTAKKVLDSGFYWPTMRSMPKDMKYIET